MVNNIYQMAEMRGLGDVVKRVAEATRMDKVANFIAKKVGAKDCGCNARADKLNELVPFKKKKA
jgi:hypothetical protein|tara:strand:- start:554 stop:745 length:192 start_codon:yes stop_codon:yes gene_type:complete